MLENIMSPNRINIKDLVIEEPQKGSVLNFDPEWDISAKYWNGIFNYLEWAKERKNWAEYLELARHVALLSPQRINQLTIDQETSDEMADRLKEEMKISNRTIIRFIDGMELFEVLSTLDLLYPDIHQTIMESIEELPVRWEVLGIDIEKNKNVLLYDKSTFKKTNDFYLGEVLTAGAISRMYSLQDFEDPVLGFRKLFDQDLWKETEEYFHNIESQKNFFEYAKIAASSRIIYPQEFSSLKLSKAFWDKAYSEIRDTQYVSILNTNNYFEFALYMKILAAEEVRVTDQGINIVMHKPKDTFSEVKSKLPEIRRF